MLTLASFYRFNAFTLNFRIRAHDIFNHQLVFPAVQKEGGLQQKPMTGTQGLKQ